jgi:hypothetical protein
VAEVVNLNLIAEHHHVDYSKFKNNKLIKVVDTRSMPKINNYGMVLVNVPDKEAE